MKVFFHKLLYFDHVFKNFKKLILISLKNNETKGSIFFFLSYIFQIAEE